jgi:hypothetical protein
MVPGRGCPLDYRYGARSLAAPATLHTESLWLAGGLYGNVPALHSLERLFLAERGPSALVFNGDFHWFDCADHNFAAIERGVSQYQATRGNVESELALPQADAGCGCAYPDWVDEPTVTRSNRIIERLRHAAHGQPGAAARMAALPMFRIAEVGGQRVAIVHGDADSLAGWGFSRETLATPAGRRDAQRAFAEANVSVFASSHTCQPVLQSFEGERVVVNNGAAGMPNFEGAAFGLATRISVRPGDGALYRERAGPLYIEAHAIRYDQRAWLEEFLAQWPPGSDAHASYFARMTEGPDYRVAAALRAA